MNINVKEVNVTIQCIEKYSNDMNGNKYRYLLEKIWDINRRKATIIMLNPSSADVVKSDRTATNVMNFLVDNNYGSMKIVNIFAYVSTDKSKLLNKNENFEALNNDYIIEAVKDADDIIIAWTRGENITRKREVLSILENYNSKPKCFKDNHGKVGRHPRDINSNWEIVDYNSSLYI